MVRTLNQQAILAAFCVGVVAGCFCVTDSRVSGAMGEVRHIVLVGTDGTEWYSVRTYETVADCYPTSLVRACRGILEDVRGCCDSSGANCLTNQSES